MILLENAGYDVISVSSGAQALDALRDEPFALAILDHNMSNADGIGTLTELRRFLPELPVVVCASDVIADHDTARYHELGVHELLSTSLDPFALRDRIAPILKQHQPDHGVHQLTTPSFRAVQSPSTTPMRSPLAAGNSKFARKLQTDLLRLHNFRSLAILEGPLGSGKFEVALSLAPSDDAHTFVYHAEEFDVAHLDPLLKPAIADSKPVFFVILEADSLDADHQAFIEDLLSGRAKNYEFLAKRLRIVFVARTSLSDLHVNELLLMRAVTSTLRLPDFADRWMDWVPISRAILSRLGTGRSTLDPEAIRWIDRHVWTGNFMQLHRVLELARRRAGLDPVVKVPHLEYAVVAEPSCNDPLFHDLLFHVHTHAVE
jgi:DNA-binding NtrC family response regulator